MADGNGSSADRSRLTLKSLATTLGCSTDVFFGETASDRIADAEELLRLWLSLEDSSKRRRVLDFARAVESGIGAEHGD